MPKPSLFEQVKAVHIPGDALKKSPRHWNCGLFRHDGKLWMSYRFHMDEPGGRCETAIVQLDSELRPMSRGQHIKLSESTPGSHHEDARLFIFKGKPYISYTEMTGYRPGIDYACVIKYARLKLVGRQWCVDEEFWPKFGLNNGRAKEKNWVFFDYEDRLHAVYQGHPHHVVVEIDGNKKVGEWNCPPPVWHWGQMRGGTPPIRQGDTYLSFFHSSVRTEIAPHYVRYYAGAYVFEAKPPFKPISVSRMPVMAGSEVDGHKVDPRYVEGWKPFVVFPCGAVPEGDSYLVSLGVNDWACAIARVGAAELQLIPADGSVAIPRFFQRENGSMPMRATNDQGALQFIPWTVPMPGAGCTPGMGYMRVPDLRLAQEISEISEIKEITEQEYDRAMRAGMVGRR